MAAFADHGQVTKDPVTPNLIETAQILDDISALGIDLAEVYDKLEVEGIDKFVVS